MVHRTIVVGEYYLLEVLLIRLSKEQLVGIKEEIIGLVLVVLPQTSLTSYTTNDVA